MFAVLALATVTQNNRLCCHEYEYVCYEYVCYVNLL